MNWQVLLAPPARAAGADRFAIPLKLDARSLCGKPTTRNPLDNLENHVATEIDARPHYEGVPVKTKLLCGSGGNRGRAGLKNSRNFPGPVGEQSSETRGRR